MTIRVACIQNNATNNMQTNIDQIETLVNQAYEDGATFITIPESAAFMAANRDELFNNSFTQDTHPFITTMQEKASALGVWLCLGGVSVKRQQDASKLRNRALVINNSGNIVSTYDKIHLYDAQVSGGESHSESSKYEAGNALTIVKTPWATLGLSICFDLRFPYQYRDLAQHGAEILLVPAAFTSFTGQAHWEPLLKARAIENNCYVIAPAQTGQHPANRSTYGHSLIIEPWGNIVADAGTNLGVICADIDINKVHTMREQIPGALHNAPYSL